MFQHIFVPTDGSALSELAVQMAVNLAKENHASLTFFFAKPNSDASVYGETALLRSLDPELIAKASDEEADKILATAVARAHAAGVTCRALSGVADEPYEAIIAAAEDEKCDLILMASHGRRGVKGLLLGSQTQKVLTHSKFPVLVYR